MRKFFAGLLIAVLSVSPLAFAAVRTGDGTKTVTTAGTAVALTSTSQFVTSLIVCGDTNNTGKIILGDTPVHTAGAQEGAIISAGGCVGMGAQNPRNAFDIALVKVNSTVSGEEASYFWMLETD